MHSKRDGFRLSVIADYRANQKSYQWVALVFGSLAVFLSCFTVLPLSRGDTFTSILLFILAGVLLIAARALRSLSLRFKGMADTLE